MSGRRPLTGIMFLVVAAALWAACSRESAPGPPTTTSAAAPTAGVPGVPRIELALIGVEANGGEPPSEEVVGQAKALVERYVADAVVAPLHSGKPAPDLSELFGPEALERVTGADRVTMVEEGLPPASRGIRAEAASLALSTLAGPGGTALVGARLELRLVALGPGLDVDIVRQGDLVLAPYEQGWRIDAFHVLTSRKSRT